MEEEEEGESEDVSVCWGYIELIARGEQACNYDGSLSHTSARFPCESVTFAPTHDSHMTHSSFGTIT
jgi:hypothetical protein